MRYRRCFFCFCLITFSTIILYLLFTDQDILDLRSLDTYFSTFSSYNSIIKYRNKSRITSQALFQTLIPSDYYPRLPIHIYTQNLTSISNTTKLILLANGFFDAKNWGLNAIGKSSSELMTQLSCPFLANYCDITTDKARFSEADAVVYHARDYINQKQARRYRHPDQRFVFALWESPAHTPQLKSYKNFFNWTMTYRSKSHIIASYYYASAYIHTSNNYFNLMLKEKERKKLNLNFKKHDHQLSDELLANKKLGTVAALISNCGGSSRRLLYIKYLKRYIDIDVYGKCGRSCPSDTDCKGFIAKNYYFFLSFENSLCTDYATEKFFSTLEYPIVPVVFGRSNYSYFIPSSGFVDTSQFLTLVSLAKYLNETRYDKEKYLSYFSWKKDYVWGLTHHFTAFCDLCVRLHLDSTPNVIDDMDAWWNEDACQRPRFSKL